MRIYDKILTAPRKVSALSNTWAFRVFITRQHVPSTKEILYTQNRTGNFYNASGCLKIQVLKRNYPDFTVSRVDKEGLFLALLFPGQGVIESPKKTIIPRRGEKEGEMNCEEYEKLITRFAEGGEPLNDEEEEMCARHLESCPECQEREEKRIKENISILLYFIYKYGWPEEGIPSAKERFKTFMEKIRKENENVF